MKTNLLLSALVVLVLAMLVPVTWAGQPAGNGGPDSAKLTSIVTTPTTTLTGQTYTVGGTVNAGDSISLHFTVGASGSGSSSTVYSDTLHLSSTTQLPPGATVSVTGLVDCTLDSRTDTCSETANIIAPATPGAYTIKILANDGRTGNNGLQQDFFFVTFTVVVPSCTPEDTTLTLGTPACTLLHADSVSLSATLTSNGNALVGKTITFYVDGNAVGTVETNASGVANLAYDPSALTVGDYDVAAEWTSDDSCYKTPRDAAGTLGIQYLFLGFQQPINADGSSVFNGRSVPVKIKIADADAAAVTDAKAVVFFADGTNVIVGTDVANGTTGLNFDYGNVMRYDLTANQYVYNWDLSTTTNGTKTVRVFFNDGSCADPHQAVISVGKKK